MPKHIISASFLKNAYLNEKRTIKDISKEIGCDVSITSRELKKYGINTASLYSPSRSKRFSFLTQEFLTTQFIENEKSVKQISSEFKCSQQIISKKLHLLGYATPSGRKLKKSTLSYLENKDFLVLQYINQGKSVRELSKEFGCAASILFRYLKLHNIPIRATYEMTPHNIEKNRIRGLLRYKNGYIHHFKGKTKETSLGLRSISNKHIKRLQGLGSGKVESNMKIARDKLNSLRRTENYKYPWEGKTLEEYYGKEKANIIRKKFSTAALDRIESGKHKKFTNTRPHRKMRRILKWVCSLNIQEEKRVENFCVPDFSIPEKRIAFFADGDYWHANPTQVKRYQKSKLNTTQEKNIVRDLKVNTFLKTNGWKTIRSWESTLLKTPEMFVSEVKRVLQHG